MHTFIRYTLCASFAVACNGSFDNDDESVGVANQQLKYIASSGPLTRKSFAQTSEAQRQANTQSYYGTTTVVSEVDGSSGTISSKLPNLAAFKSNYRFGSTDVKTYYYNRGDLGIGREMHCVDRPNQIACYVVNFAAGDDQSEFRFGMSPNVAFTNMDNGVAFATVAMVLRKGAPAGQRILFAVYDAAGVLANAAPLDRHGFNAARGLVDNEGVTGVSGVNFNNHIPSNCLNCHGGTYNSSTKVVTGSLFLPFDLDQFDFQEKATRTRDEQLSQFEQLNDIVIKVAQSAGAPTAGAQKVQDQINGWYASGTFDSLTYVPPAWATAEQKSIYTSVVRGSCQSCHVTSPISFDTPANFAVSTVVTDLCSLQMPHALQAVREFWQSSRPVALEKYIRSVNPAEADRFRSCAPGNVVTLDPHRIVSLPSLD